MPRWPRRMSSWWLSSVFATPIDPTSRPDENDLPSPRQMIARTSVTLTQLAEDRRTAAASISSSNALCLSGLSFVIVAMAPSTSRRMRSDMDSPRIYLM